jgi:glycerol-3-phosphate acyltransferase PlsX
LEHLWPVASQLTPESQGGAMLLGVQGICIISHGSSNATAIMNALRVADEVDKGEVVAKLALTIRPDQAA